MAFHIVTSRCFLACEKITSVVLEELLIGKPAMKRKGKKSMKPKVKDTAPTQFCIVISYYPLIASQSNVAYNNGPTGECLEIKINKKQDAMALYAEIIREVQEQHPNEVYLDKLIDKVLTSGEFVSTEKDNAAI